MTLIQWAGHDDAGVAIVQPTVQGPTVSVGGTDGTSTVTLQMPLTMTFVLPVGWWFVGIVAGNANYGSNAVTDYALG